MLVMSYPSYRHGNQHYQQQQPQPQVNSDWQPQLDDGNNRYHLHEDAQALYQLSTPRINGQISVQPSCYQIAHYNVHPIPCLAFDTPLESDETIYAELLQQSSHFVVASGFLKGDVKLAKAGTSRIYFPGLKLNKKGVIKACLRTLKLDRADSHFLIRFRTGSSEWLSTPFRLVSNYNQLPEEHKPNIRPPRRKIPPTTPVDHPPANSPPRSRSTSPDPSPSSSQRVLTGPENDYVSTLTSSAPWNPSIPPRTFNQPSYMDPRLPPFQFPPPPLSQPFSTTTTTTSSTTPGNAQSPLTRSISPSSSDPQATSTKSSLSFILN